MNREMNRDKWFFCKSPNPNASIRLFCFPFAGGGASVFRGWEDRLGSSIELRALQLPGRESRYNEPCAKDLNTLIPEIVNALLEYQDKPFALFGYSLGSLLAFEVCRELRKKNKELPVHLFIGALSAPQNPRVHPAFGSFGDQDFISKIEEYYQPQDPAWNILELRELMLPVLKSDITLVDNYIYQEDLPLPSPIDVFAGDDDIAVPVQSTLNWSEQTIGEMRHHIFKGGHFFIDQAVSEIQQIVSDTLQRKF